MLHAWVIPFVDGVERRVTKYVMTFFRTGFGERVG